MSRLATDCESENPGCTDYTGFLPGWNKAETETLPNPGTFRLFD